VNDEDYSESGEPLIIGYATKCENCGKEIIIFAAHERPLCAECSMKLCPIVRKKLKDETNRTKDFDN